MLLPIDSVEELAYTKTPYSGEYNFMDSNEREYLSKEGFVELQKRLADLKTKKRLEIAEHLEYAKGLGDLSENAEYAEAKEEQMANEAKIVELEDLLSRAEVIVQGDTNKVCVGSTVFCVHNGDAEERFMIVGREEADPGRGKISNESPLGRAFLGKKRDEKILVSTPRGGVTYHILDIS